VKFRPLEAQVRTSGVFHTTIDVSVLVFSEEVGMSAGINQYVKDFVAERHLPADEVWRRPEPRLDRPIGEDLNRAHESCDRWARDRSRWPGCVGAGQHVEAYITALAHDGVAEAVVVAPDLDRRAVVRAVVVLNGRAPGCRVAGEAQRTVGEMLGRRAAPRIVDFVEALPRTETAEIRRNVLRAQN
jgi:AMP-binding enzyme C-terminal domain